MIVCIVKTKPSKTSINWSAFLRRRSMNILTESWLGLSRALPSPPRDKLCATKLIITFDPRQVERTTNSSYREGGRVSRVWSWRCASKGCTHSGAATGPNQYECARIAQEILFVFNAPLATLTTVLEVANPDGACF